MTSVSRSTSLIVVTIRPSEIAFAQSIAKFCQIPLQVVGELGKVREAIASIDYPILILDSSIAEPKQAAAELRGLLEARQLHLLATGLEIRAIADHFDCESYGHFILRKVDENSEADGILYSRVVQASIRPTSMGLSSLLFSKIEKINFTETLQKKFAATSVTYYLQENGFNEQLCSVVGTAVDELLMNAMLVALDEVQMEVSLDQDILGITVADRQGSLNRSKVLGHLKHNFNADMLVMRGAEQQGAGIGLSQILKAGGSVLFNVNAGQRTEASLLIRKTKSYREVRKQMQFVSTLYT